VVEAVSDALGVPSTTFAEYRLWNVQRLFDRREVGFEQAIANLASWEQRVGQTRQDAVRSLPLLAGDAE
jgi:hypothetical protein